VRGELSYARGVGQVVLEDPQVHLYFDEIHADRKSAEVGAEVRVYAGINGDFGLIHRTRLNLTSSRARMDTAKHLDSRFKLDWGPFIEDACWQVVDAFRQGRKSIPLAEAKAPPGGSTLLPPLLLSRDPVIIFGDGGNAKSYLALALALSVESGLPLVGGLKPAARLHTAYLDFEWHEWPHRQRAVALWGSEDLPGVEYVPCQAEGPLSQQIDRLRGIFQEKGIQYAVIDSVALACDGPPEDAQVALAFFQALARLEVGAVMLAHVNKSGDTDKPFGSAFWHNSARATWYVKRAQEVGGSSLNLGLYQRKVNDGTTAHPLGLRFDFTPDRTTISQADLNRVPELAGGLPLKERMTAELRSGALTVTELAERLEVSSDTVRVTFRRQDGKLFTNLGGDPYKIGLLAHT
jgi:hypothetical protein